MKLLGMKLLKKKISMNFYEFYNFKNSKESHQIYCFLCFFIKRHTASVIFVLCQH